MQKSQRTRHRLISLVIITGLLLQQFSAIALAAPPQQPADAPPAAAAPARRLADAKAAPLRVEQSAFFADLNGDRRVDANDLRAAANGWNCASGDGCFSPALDRDGSGVIDALDLAAIANEFDTAAPVIAITSPADGAVVSGGTVQVQGTVADSHAISEVSVNGVAAALNGDSFAASVPATDGGLLIQAAAADALGQTASASVLVAVDSSGPTIEVEQPPHRQSVYTKRPEIQIRYADLNGDVAPGSLRVTLTDESGGVTDVTGALSATASAASGTAPGDLLEDESYTLTATVQDTNGNSSSVQTTFYVPLNADSITPPSGTDGSGFVSGTVYDSTSCGGEQAFDPIDCTGIPGATVTLEQVDDDALALARAARLADLNAARARRARTGAPDVGLPASASRAPVAFRAQVAGTVVTGPDGFFAFPAEVTGSYALRVEKDGFTYGQRIVEIVKGKSSTSSDIFVTPLDPAVTACTDAGCQHTSSDGQMELDVPTGAIPGGQTLDIRATEFDQVQFLPSGELPPGTGETYAFNLSGASEMTFTHPITVKVKNDRGFAPGAQIPLGYWNQELLVWEHAGTSTVDASGEWLVMNVTHFSNFDPNAPVTPANAQVEAKDETKKPGKNCASDCDSSEIDLATGVLKQAFSLPTVQVLDEPTGVTLLYDSSRANPGAVIDVALSLRELVPDASDGILGLIQAELFIEGESTDQFSFRVEELEADGEIGRFRYAWDGRNAQGERLPPGAYDYQVRVKIPFRAQFFRSTTGRFGGPPDPSQPLGVFTNSTIERSVQGTVVLNGDDGQQFGAGWQVADVQRLYESEDGSVVIDDGDQALTHYFFPRNDRTDDPPQVLTLGRDPIGVPRHLQARQGEAAPLFRGSQPSALSAVTAEVGSSRQASGQAVDASVANAPAAIATDVTADISADTVWTVANSPYRVRNDITVQAGVTLTVQPGVQVRVESGSTTPASIFVDGNLLAEGSAGNKIIFTSETDATNQRWGGIVVQNGGAARLVHTDLRFGGRADVLGRDAGVAVISSTLAMSNSTMTAFGNFSNTPDGCLLVQNSGLTLETVSFDDCGSPGFNNPGQNTVASVVLLGEQTTVQASGVTVSNSHRFSLALDPALLDAIPAFTFDKSSLFLFAGAIDRDVTVSAASGISEVMYADDVTVPAGRTLTVGPGVRWSAFDTDTKIVVQGKLEAQGTAGQPVVFTSDEDSEGGQWSGIFVDGGSAEFAFTSVRFGGRLEVDNRTANLLVKNGDLRFVNSESLVAQDFGGGVSSHLTLIDSSAFIDGALISDNGLNGANPEFGVEIVETDARAAAAGEVTIQNSTIVHKRHPVSLPLSRLGGISELNTFTTGANGRFHIQTTEVSGDVTLGPRGNLATYEFDRDTTVTGRLTLEPGTRLLSRGTFLRMDGGTLTAHGTKDAPVVFASRDGVTRSWDGLHLQNGGVADLRFVEIREAFRGIDISDGSLRLQYSKVLDNEAGIFLSGSAPEFFVHLNEFSGNTAAAIGNRTNPRVTLDARLNFWGDPSGPTHPNNPGGTGDRFTGQVLFDPFLTGADVDSAAAVNLTAFDVTQLTFDITTGTFTRHYPDGSLVHFNADGFQDFSRDTNGNEIRYSYNPDGSLAQMAFVANGRADADWRWTFTYDDGRRTTDERSAPTSGRRSSAVAGQVTVTDPAGRTTTLTIDKNGNLASLQEPGLAAPMTFAYGAQGNMTHKTDARGHTTTYEYDADGRVARSLLPPREVFDPETGTFSSAQEIHEFAPSAATGPVVNGLAAKSPGAPNDPLPRADKVSSGQTVNGRTSQIRTNEFGAVTGSVDPLGNESSTERDERDNITKMRFASGICTEFTYNEFDLVTSETLLQPDQCDLPAAQRDPQKVQQTLFTYEPRFNQIKTTTDALGRTTTFVYDYEVEQGEAGNLVQILLPGVENGEASRAVVNPTETFAYNSAGQVTRKVDRRGTATCFIYTTGDASEAGTLFAGGVTPVPGLLTEEIEDCGGSLERRSRFTNFDAGGNAGALIEFVGTARERTTTFSYDGRNRTVAEQDALGNRFAYEYDNGDNLIRETRTGRDGQVEISEFVFNPVNDLTARTDRGDGLSRTVRFGYDLDRNETLHVDFNGNQERSFYDANNQVIRTVDPLGGVYQMTYDPDGRMLSSTDPRGSITQFVYDGFGREIEQIQDVGGLNVRRQQAYDLVGNVTARTDPLGTRTCLTYDALNRLIEEIADCGGSNRTTTILYNLDNLPVATTDTLDRTTRLTYDALDRAVQTTDALGGTVTSTYDPADSVVAITDELGNTARFEYDILGRLVQSTDPLGGTVRQEYDAFDLLTGLTDELGRTFRYEYDGLNRRTAVVDPVGGRTTYAFDLNDNVVASTDPRGVTANFTYNAQDRQTLVVNGDGSTAAFEYDANLNQTAIVDGFGQRIVSEYDALDRLIGFTDREGNRSTYAYDPASNLISETDPQGGLTQYTYDPLYQKTQMTRPNGETVSYAYDAVGNLASLTDGAGNTTTYAYDALNREVSETNALGQTRTTEYAADGLPTRSVDRNGNDYRFEYDALRRLIRETEQNSGAVRTVTYDAAGQEIALEDANARYEMTYDLRGALTAMRGRFATGAPDVDYLYEQDPVGNVIRRIEQVAGGTLSTTDYQFDAMEQMTQILQRGALTKRVDMQYDANGRMTRIDRFRDGAGAALVASTVQTFNRNGLLLNLSHTTAARATRTHTYAYDSNNRITAQSSPDGATSYAYDSGDQVTGAAYDFQADESFSYDGNGNRTGGGHVTGQDNRQTSDGRFSYEYDPEGNRTRRTDNSSGATVEYAWDHLNRLVGVVAKDGSGAVQMSASYTYDVLNRRISKTVNGSTEHYAYDGLNLTLVLDGAGKVINRYLHGPLVDMILADEQSGAGSETRWLLHRGDGSVVDVLDGGGGLINHLTYDAFGTITAQTDPSVVTRWAYTGREFDRETGLYQNRTRYFDPAQGRFISQDRLGFAGGDSNLYRYAGNNPANASDPFGTERFYRSDLRFMQGNGRPNNQAAPAPQKSKVTRSFGEKLTGFLLDATIFLTDNAVVNGADSVVAGYSSGLTGGLTDRAREKIYGHHATKNQSGILYNSFKAAGFVQSFMIPGGNAKNVALIANMLKNGQQGKAALMALAQAISAAQKIGGVINLQEAIDAIANDPCLTEQQKAKKIAALMTIPPKGGTSPGDKIARTNRKPNPKAKSSKVDSSKQQQQRKRQEQKKEQDEYIQKINDKYKKKVKNGEMTKEEARREALNVVSIDSQKNKNLRLSDKTKKERAQRNHEHVKKKTEGTKKELDKHFAEEARKRAEKEKFQKSLNIDPTKNEGGGGGLNIPKIDFGSGDISF